MSASPKPYFTEYPAYHILEDLFLRAGGRVRYVDSYELQYPEAANPRLYAIDPENHPPCLARFLPRINTIVMPDDESYLDDIGAERTEDELFSEMTRLFAHEMAHFLMRDYITELQYVLPGIRIGLDSFREGMADILAGVLYELARRIADSEKKPVQAP